MAELYHLARPYAKAAFEYADEKGLLTDWLSLFQMTASAFSCTEVSVYFNHPQVSQVQVANWVIDVLKIEDQAFINLLKVIAHYKRLSILSAVSKLFADLKAQKERSVHAVVTSAYVVPEYLVAKMKAKLEEKFKASVVLENKVDASLLGGAVIEVGDTVIDGSIIGKFHRLKQELIA